MECLQPVAAEGFRCVTIDHRGHGQSQKPSYGYRLARRVVVVVVVVVVGYGGLDI